MNEPVSIFTEAEAVHTPLGPTWTARAWIEDLAGAHHFETEKHGYPTATSAANAARRGTATLWGVFAAENNYRTDAS